MLEGAFGMLAFFATLLGLGAGIILLMVALVRRRLGRARRVGTLLLAWVGLYAALLLGASAASQAHTIEPGAERCFDEMCFSVTDFSIAHTLDSEASPSTPALGAGARGPVGQPLMASGDFYIVTIQLRSAAKRTAQKPSEPDLFLLDASGQRYTQALNAGDETGLPIGQPVSARQLWDQPIQAGESVLRKVAFDLPAGAPRPGLVISEGIGPLSAVIIGDENSFFHARTVFRLP